jgi:hypothetical protein
VRGVLAAMILKGNQDMCILTNAHKVTAEGDFCDECRELINLPLLKTSRYMGYIDKGDRMLIAIQLVREHEK